MGVVSARSSLANRHLTETDAGYHRCWYAVCLAGDLADGAVVGRDLLGTRLVAYRDPATGKPAVQSGWCPHLGADLSLGQITDGQLRCPYHHWSFDTSGKCSRIPTGDKIPDAAHIFTYPSREAWGLIWAFNGEKADFDPPRLPDAEEGAIDHVAYARGERAWDTWIAVSNGVDFQHLRTLHGLPATSMPDKLEVEQGAAIEFDIDNEFYRQHGRISGTNTFAQHLRVGGEDMYQMFTGTPIVPGRSLGFAVVGVPKGAGEPRLAGVRNMVDRLGEEDGPVLSTIRFRRGLLTAADRHLARYFKYADEFPTFLPAV
jgi:phenylpropionate dioxygenase-like ring-hydroxylating dioxygenase large terminal subunit